MARIKNAKRNLRYGYLNTISTLLVKFFTRTFFIYTIGVTYLGVNGLYTNVLSVLSLADLGISTALNFSLYKPVATGDLPKIRALMKLFKKAYLGIAFVITILGLALVPFLSILVKDPVGITTNELRIYYLIFLFNTVSTYFVSYKYSLTNADQRNYIQINFRTVTTILTAVLQIFILVVFNSFLWYLLSASIIELLHKIFVNRYINKRYAYLTDAPNENLSKEELAPIIKNIKALIFHKIGSVSVHQTDNILISTFINITTVGIVSNYTLVITSITKFIDIMFNSVISGLGNLVATEDIEKQYYIFKIYRFIGFWLYGFFAISFFLLLGPFIQLWIGKEMVLAANVVSLILLDYYLKGHRIVVNNFKIAAGVFDQDKYVAIAQAIVNLVVSIVLVRKVGLIGIYIGTVVQGLISTMTRPIILYSQIFHKKWYLYYKDSIIYLIVLAFPLVILSMIQNFFFNDITIMNFILFGVIDVIIVNGFFLLCLWKREEFKYVVSLLKRETGLGKDGT
ncbi:lipopolysaccharide biosynthesis protein [Sphaerochaeta halotolerans]|uniref:lipopolysaccharide biosynthesis protein n=1 Tax=Sphaerochaeta halotolerans TaxID=2293840 RepID=UPI00136EB549|nr:polysaccharide biosynthesis protein [Sphaerochaeta halotolerans]MXI87567.1 polysaccharide biosynthesis protein [Sphaerochaeta halotolerans]